MWAAQHGGCEHGCGARHWVQTPALLLPGSMSRGQKQNLSVAWFPHLQKATMMIFQSLVLRSK